MDLKKKLFKFLQFWPWILLSLALCMVGALFFIQTIKPTFQSSALININKEEEKNKNIINITTEDKSKEETLENEMMLITSNEFLLKVIKNLKLNISYFEKGYIQNKIVDEEPFIINPIVALDKMPNESYEVLITKEGFTVVNSITKKSKLISGHFNFNQLTGLPFTIVMKSKALLSGLINKEFQVNLEPTESVLKKLKKALVLKVDEKAKGSLQLLHSGKSPIRSREILDEVISLLDQSIINNKQKLFNSTVSFLNQRISEFTKEKDSIESVKENYLQKNDVLVLENYIIDKTSKKTVKKEDYLKNEMQLYLTKFALKEIINTPDNTFMGTNYNLDEPIVNQLLSKYNETLLESELILQRAQKNNPAYTSLLIELKAQKKAIVKNLEASLIFLNKEKETTVAQKDVAIKEANTIPTKDKILGNINGDLSMKQEIYIILLQKREEAILNGAVIESNIKILNTPETNYSPTFPQKRPFMLGAFLLGLLIPLGVIYAYLQFDTKIRSKDDVLEFMNETSFLGVLPQVDENEKFLNGVDSRSSLAETTRSIFSNIIYLLSEKKEANGNVILVTSSISGEGKTFTAFQTAVTISSSNKKVLLVGADLRKPQLHKYIKEERQQLGLSNYLAESGLDWKDMLITADEISKDISVLLSGPIPPNPSQLLSNNNFKNLLEEARSIFDYIIIDSAPVLLVSDTFSFSKLVDVSVFVSRSNYSDKKGLILLKEFIRKKQLNNVGIVVNGIDFKKKMVYGYGYSYGYGYGYGAEVEKKTWFEKFKSMLGKKA